MVVFMKKYVVVCYSVHEKEIASHDSFDNEDDAYAFPYFGAYLKGPYKDINEHRLNCTYIVYLDKTK